MQYVITVKAKGNFFRAVIGTEPVTEMFRSHIVRVENEDEARQLGRVLLQSFQIEVQSLGTLKELFPETIERLEE